MREINEGIEQVAERFGAREHLFDFLCECARIDCVERMSMTVPEYEAVRSRAERFAVLAGHEVPDIERVVERTDRYSIVEKSGEGAAVARELDPRTSSA